MIKREEKHNLKYLSRLHYYGKLLDWDYVGEFMILKLKCFTATEYYANNVTIRLLVPTIMEKDIKDELIVGDNYYIIAAPYSLLFDKKYRHRVDLLLHIFKEVA